MHSLVMQLNGHQALYIALCYASLVLAAVLGMRAIGPAWREAVSGAVLCRPDWSRGIPFLLALSAMVVLFRLPNVLTDRVLEVDECGHIVSLAADGGLWYWPLERPEYYDSGNRKFEPLLDIPRKPVFLGNIFGKSD